MRMTIKDLSHRDSFDFATVKKDMFLLVGARDPCDAASTAVCDADRGFFFFSLCVQRWLSVAVHRDGARTR